MASPPPVSHKEKYTADSGIVYNIEYHLLTNYAGVYTHSDQLSLPSTVHYIRFDDKINSFIVSEMDEHHSKDQNLMAHMNDTYKALLKIKAFV